MRFRTGLSALETAAFQTPKFSEATVGLNEAYSTQAWLQRQKKGLGEQTGLQWPW